MEKIILIILLSAFVLVGCTVSKDNQQIEEPFGDVANDNAGNLKERVGVILDADKILPSETEENNTIESVDTTGVEAFETIHTKTAETIDFEIENTPSTEIYFPDTVASEKLRSETTLWDNSLDFTENSYSTDADHYEDDLLSGYWARDIAEILPKLESILGIYSNDTRIAVATFWLWESDMEVHEKNIFGGKCLSNLSDEYGQLVQERFNIEMRICEDNSCSREEAQQYAEYIEADRRCNEAYELLINAEKHLEYLRWEPSREYLRSFGFKIEYDYYLNNPDNIDCYMEFLGYTIVFVGTIGQVDALISDLTSRGMAFSLGLALDKDLYDDFVKTYGDPHIPPFLINGEIVNPHKE